MDKAELEKRTKQFALRIIAFAVTLPVGKTGDVIRYQLVKAGTSVGANYREANRAESRNDFIHKIGIVEKEASESQYWLEICDEANFGVSSANGYYKSLVNFWPFSRALEERLRRQGLNNSQSEIRNPKFLLCQ